MLEPQHNTCKVTSNYVCNSSIKFPQAIFMHGYRQDQSCEKKSRDLGDAFSFRISRLLKRDERAALFI